MDASVLLNSCISLLILGFTASTLLIQKIARFQKIRRNELQNMSIPKTLQKGLFFYIFCYFETITYVLLLFLCIFITILYTDLGLKIAAFLPLAMKNSGFREARSIELFALYGRNLSLVKWSLLLLLPTLFLMELWVPNLVEKKLTQEQQIYTKQLRQRHY